VAEPVARTASAEQTAVDHEFAEKLKKCHDKLPEKYRPIFDGFVAGESYEALAAALEIPLGTVQSRLSRARAALKKCVGLAGPDDEEPGDS
jgi:RNA polymerase sigma factor (sigma-70 family)